MSSENLPENKVVITDTSCFSLLRKLDAIDILHQLFSIVITTPEIAAEFRFPLPDWVLILEPVNKMLQQEYLKFVDSGEASAIALATEIDCDYLILDDGAARKLALKLGLPVKGTTGVLLAAKQKGIIPAFRPYLELIQQTNFRLSTALIEQFLRDAGE